MISETTQFDAAFGFAYVSFSGIITDLASFARAFEKWLAGLAISAAAANVSF